MNKNIFLIVVWGFLIALMPSTLLADEDKDNRLLFENIFRRWTDAFNQRNLSTSCEFFSKSLVADYQGTKQKNYETICNGFKKIFDQSNRHYHYDFKIHQIYHRDDLAAIRVTWYLDIYKNGKLLSRSQDEGLDVLEKQHGEWRIVNYVAYPK